MQSDDRLSVGLEIEETMSLAVKKLHLRACSLVTEFKRGNGAHFIDEAILLDREALRLCPSDHALRHLSLDWLAFRLFTRYSQLREISDLEETIALHREALDFCSQGHPSRLTSLNNLAVCLFTRYSRSGGISDLEEAIVLHRATLDLRPQGHPRRSTSLNNLARDLITRYKQLGGISDLEEAIVLHQEALDLHPQGHPNRSTSLNNLASGLSIRYSQLGGISDLQKAIVLHREALDLRPQGHPGRSISLNNLASGLSTRYLQLGGISDLEKAIVLHREALDLRPRGHPDRSMSLNNLAHDLAIRCKQLGEVSDLEEAILLHQTALGLRPGSHSDRSMSLSNLAVALHTRYLWFGEISDLEEATVLDREALDLRPQGHPDRSTSLNNLAVDLSTWYSQLGEISDLEDATMLHREALDLRPQGHPDRSASLNNLARDLSIRYKQLGGISDLEEAIGLHRTALDLRPEGHPYRSMSLNNLALALYTRYSRFGEISDLEKATVLDREALDLRPQGHPDRSTSLNNLARDLSVRYKRLGGVSNLKMSIALSKESLGLHPKGHLDRSESLENLALYLTTRYHVSMQSDDKELMFNLYGQLEHVPHVMSSNDLSAAGAWIRAAEHFQHPTLLPAYETFLRFLVQHSIIFPSLPQHLPVLKKIVSSLGVDAFSICLRNNSTANAVELLEQGRCVFWAQLIHLSSPLDNVIASGPVGETLAADFTRITSLIRNNIVNLPGSNQHKQSYRLRFELQKVVTKIRELPGLSRFLLPSLFSDLRHAASGGPVIIVNASKYSCDALIVFLDRDPIHVPLKSTKKDIESLVKELHTLWMDMKTELAAFLQKLWDQIVSPIFNHLQSVHPIRTRIWWCPTGEFSLLPLHAAGLFRKGQQNIPELYISSYTPTLSALIRARRPSLRNPADKQKHFVAIGQANAVDPTERFSVSAELNIIRERLDGLASLTSIDREDSCIARIIGELSRNEWAHLTCHSIPNWERPFESAFALHDGYLTIRRMLACESEDAEFAFLSAGHTTTGGEENLDEMIHLASAMQFIGFRSVIGTMWEVDNGETNKVVATFYEHMVDESGQLDHTRAAHALNRTMQSVDIPLDQKILYVHLGA